MPSHHLPGVVLALWLLVMVLLQAVSSKARCRRALVCVSLDGTIFSVTFTVSAVISLSFRGFTFHFIPCQIGFLILWKKAGFVRYLLEYKDFKQCLQKGTLQTMGCASQVSPSIWAFCSSELDDGGAVPPVSSSDFTSPLGPCFKGRSILNVMAVEVQYSSNPYKYLQDETFFIYMSKKIHNKLYTTGQKL